jgi:hypothetical protein
MRHPKLLRPGCGHPERARTRGGVRTRGPPPGRPCRAGPMRRCMASRPPNGMSSSASTPRAAVGQRRNGPHDAVPMHRLTSQRQQDQVRRLGHLQCHQRYISCNGQSRQSPMCVEPRYGLRIVMDALKQPRLRPLPVVLVGNAAPTPVRRRCSRAVRSWRRPRHTV